MIAHIQRTTFKVSDFINWQKYGSLILSPKFQRRSVWNPDARSFLLDTILKGLPIPVIILRDVKTDVNSYESRKEVVDGQQRLRAIISYVAPEMIAGENVFKIKSIHNEQAGNKLFSDLKNDLKQRILDYEFFVHVLPSSVSDREILEIFSRMNSTGYKLNNQELRNAEYYGEFKTTVYNLALEYYDFWLTSGLMTDAKISRMDEVDLMNNLFTVVMDGIIDRSPEVIDRYYKDYNPADSFANKEEVVSRIRTCLNFINETFNKEFDNLVFFAKPQLFYSLFAVIYDYQYGLESILKKKTAKKLNATKLKQNADKLSKRIADVNNNTIPEKVLISYTKGTNRKTARINVFDFLKKELLNGI